MVYRVLANGLLNRRTGIYLYRGFESRLLRYCFGNKELQAFTQPLLARKITGISKFAM
jgi:hypothetical protein